MAEIRSEVEGVVMSHPYRTTLPQVPSNPQMSVCAWCVHCRVETYGVGLPRRVCSRNVVPHIDPVDGRTTRGVERQCREANPDGRCPHYQPTWFTRLAWWRRVP
jgi:hypothetical protein